MRDSPRERLPFVRSTGAIALALGLGAAAPASAQTEAEIFQRHEESIFKVEVVETLSGSPYVVGTAFVVDVDGRLVTNYHVVNDVVFSPDDYSIRLMAVDGSSHNARVVLVDPVNDLAALEADGTVGDPMVLADDVPAVGTEVYSLGFPSDLSGTLVAGTFSGPIEHTLTSRFHYSGSLSPGMSGGPTVDARGRVVGVNVATSGNQLSYLVSVGAARDMLAEADRGEELFSQVLRRLGDFQASVGQRFFTGDGMEPRDLAPFEVESLSESVAECSASPLRPDGYDFTGVIRECGPPDGIWLDPDAAVQPVTVKHVLVVAEGMTRLRFSGLYTEWYQDVWEREVPESRWASEYVCKRRNVQNSAGVKLRVSQCWRGREKLDGLYDFVAKTAVLGVVDRGLISTLTMAGTTLENGQAFLHRVVESVRWPR